MNPVRVTSAICVARRRTSSYVVRGKGPGPPVRWQDTQASKTIGATSFENVGVCAHASESKVHKVHNVHTVHKVHTVHHLRNVRNARNVRRRRMNAIVT